VLIGGAQACNVYFIVGSSATIGAGSQMQGNILAYTSIAVDSAASNEGTFCALNGAITLIDNALTAQTTCST
jgi:acyl-[acyl carrier protein]--UDP-N-acetylglucosamine O-acyltransferase